MKYPWNKFRNSSWIFIFFKKNVNRLYQLFGKVTFCRERPYYHINDEERIFIILLLFAVVLHSAPAWLRKSFYWYEKLMIYFLSGMCLYSGGSIKKNKKKKRSRKVVSALLKLFTRNSFVRTILIICIWFRQFPKSIAACTPTK